VVTYQVEVVALTTNKVLRMLEPSDESDIDKDPDFLLPHKSES